MQKATACSPSKLPVHKHEGRSASLTWNCTATAAREPARGVPPRCCPEVRQHAGLRLGSTSPFPSTFLASRQKRSSKLLPVERQDVSQQAVPPCATANECRLRHSPCKANFTRPTAQAEATTCHGLRTPPNPSCSPEPARTCDTPAPAAARDGAAASPAAGSFCPSRPYPR